MIMSVGAMMSCWYNDTFMLKYNDNDMLVQ